MTMLHPKVHYSICVTVDSEIFAKILFVRIALKDI